MTDPTPPRVSEERLAQLLTFYDKDEHELHLVEEDAADCIDALRELVALRSQLPAAAERSETGSAARDAARYAWLRDRWFIAGELFPEELHDGAVTASHFDEAIDSAIAAEREGE